MNHLDMKRSTFVLPTQMLQQMRSAVKAGMAHSVSSLVREALERRLRELKKEYLRRQFEAAARDSAFLNEIKETMQVFEAADRETARMIPAW